MFNQVKGKTWITKEQARALQVTRCTLQVTRHTSHVTRYKLQVTTLGQVDSNDKSVRGHGDKRQFTLLLQAEPLSLALAGLRNGVQLYPVTCNL